MIYDDGVKTNAGLRVMSCPVCSNEELDEDDKYCIICGAELYNYCTGTYQDELGFNIRYMHLNKSNARYCSQCGEKTTFFKKAYLVSYKEFQENIQAESEAIPFY